MKVTIKPVVNSSYGCLEAIIITLAQYWNIRYEMLFCDSWGFGYNVDSRVAIHEHITTGISRDKWKIIHQYHGIQLKSHTLKQSDSIINYIEYQLKNEQPVLLKYNWYWCPWDIAYKKYHLSHYSLAVAIDKHEETITCIDPYFSSDQLELPFDDFINGYEGFLSVEQVSETCREINYKDIINDTIHKLTGDLHLPNAFDAMRSFAAAIKAGLDLTSVINGYEDLEAVPLFGTLKDLESGRRKYAMFLNFLSQHATINMDEFSKILIDAAEKWLLIRTNLIKLVFRDKDTLREKIYSHINAVSDFEESIVQKLYSLI